MKGADAGFLYAEDEVQSMTTPIVVVLRPASGRPLTIDDLRAHVAARLDLLPSFRRRVERVPFGAHHPVLVDDPDFDLGYHLRHVTLDDPSPAGVEAFAAAQQEVRLDRRHPLWRMVLVDGLHDGRQALVLLWSHALADGTACRTTLRRLLTDVEPAELAAVRAAEPFAPAPVRRIQVFRDGVADLLRSLLALVLAVRRFSQGSKAVAARRAEAPVVVPEQADTPVTSLNDAWSGRRAVATSEVPLADVLRVRAAARAAVPGVTVNDVLLAMASGSLRSWLGDDLPDAPLTINIPVSTEPAAVAGVPDRQWGNHFTNYLSSLATDVDDPVERLRRISAVAKEGRLQLDILGPTALVEMLDHIPACVAEPGARAMGRDKQAKATEKADYSVLLSNVRGSDAAFAFTSGSETVAVERIHVFGMPFEGTGLSLVGWTYGDRIELTAMSDVDAVADPAPILAGMVASLASLSDALEEEVVGAKAQR